MNLCVFLFFPSQKKWVTYPGRVQDWNSTGYTQISDGECKYGLKLFTIQHHARDALIMFFPHSSRCPSTTGQKLLPQRVLQSVQSSVSSLHFPYPLFYFRSFCSYLRHRLHFPRYPSFLLTYVRYISPPWLCVTVLYISHIRSNWSFPFFCSSTFQNLPFISSLRQSLYLHWHPWTTHVRNARNVKFALHFRLG
jgi:hypothetical protein